MRVEALRAGEPPQAVLALLRGGEDALRAAAAAHPVGALVAFEGGVPCAVLSGAVIHCGYVIRAVDGPSIEAAFPALLAHLGRAFPGQRVEARIEDETRGDPALRRALTNVPASLVLDQVRYDRDLSTPPAAPRAPRAFTLRGYDALGKAGLVALLARIFDEGPSGCVTSDPHDEAERMLFLARDAAGRPDTSAWRFAYVDGVPVGLALAHLYGDAPRSGTLLYFGLVRAQRGRRLGAALHALALRGLAEAGATAYRDATTGRNAAMQRVFERNGCRQSGVVLQYVVRRPLESGHLIDLDGLAAYLRAEGHAVEVSTATSLLTDAVSAGAIAHVEIAWDAAARAVYVTHRPPRGGAAFARIAARLNASCAVPTFFVDDRPGIRAAVLLDEANRLRVHQLRRALAEIVQASVAFEAAWSAARGSSLLERVPVLRPRGA